MKHLRLPVKWGLGAQRDPSGAGLGWQAGRGDVLPQRQELASDVAQVVHIKHIFVSHFESLEL